MKAVRALTTPDFVVDALDHLRVGIAVLDGTDRIQYCNQHLVNMFPCLGPDADALVGCQFVDLVACKLENGLTGGSHGVFDPDVLLEKRMSRHRDPAQPILEMPLSDGRWIEVTEAMTPRSGLAVSWIDITKRKRTQLQLEDAIVSTSEGYAIWDQNEKLTSSNRKFAELIAGFNQSDILGLTLHEVLKMSLSKGTFNVEVPTDQWLSTLEGDHRAGNSERILQTADGRWLRISNRRTREGHVSTVLCDVSDQYEASLSTAEKLAAFQKTSSELHTTQRQLTEVSEKLDRAKTDIQQADAGKTAFLRTMSHELRTPLNSIIGFAEILKKQLYGPLKADNYGEYADHILKSGEGLLDLINRLLDISKLESGRYTIYPDDYQLSAIIEETVALLQGRAAEKSISVEFNVEAELPKVFIDEGATHEVFMCILENAIKYSRPSGDIKIQVTKTEGGVEVVITDNGIGIAPDDLERITQPFERGSNSLAEEHQGSGLGLSIAKSLSTLQGGTLDIKSVPDGGTSVSVWFPKADLVNGALNSADAS